MAKLIFSTPARMDQAVFAANSRVVLAVEGGTDQVLFEPAAETLNYALFISPNSEFKVEMGFQLFGNGIIIQEVLLSSIFRGPLLYIGDIDMFLNEQNSRFLEGQGIRALISGDDDIIGSQQNDYLVGHTGYDFLYGDLGNDLLDGGDNFDVAVFSSARNAYAINVGASGKLFLAGPDGVDAAINVEAFRFTDGTFTLGEMLAGPVARLYFAAFDRLPDTDGLNHWIATAANGTSLQSIAGFFTGSAEFNARYGAALDARSFVEQLYRNVLGREGDPSGIEFWTNSLSSGQAIRASVLLEFANSPENVARAAAFVDELLGRPGAQTADVASRAEHGEFLPTDLPAGLTTEDDTFPSMSATFDPSATAFIA